jgi:hypothetical protein
MRNTLVFYAIVWIYCIFSRKEFSILSFTAKYMTINLLPYSRLVSRAILSFLNPSFNLLNQPLSSKLVSSPQIYHRLQALLAPPNPTLLISSSANQNQICLTYPHASLFTLCGVTNHPTAHNPATTAQTTHLLTISTPPHSATPRSTVSPNKYNQYPLGSYNHATSPPACTIFPFSILVRRFPVLKEITTGNSCFAIRYWKYSAANNVMPENKRSRRNEPSVEVVSQTIGLKGDAAL